MAETIVQKIAHLARAVHACPDVCAAFSVHAGLDSIRVSLRAEDDEDDLPFIEEPELEQVLDEALVRADAGLPGDCRSCWSQSFTGAATAVQVLQRLRAGGGIWYLAFIPRSALSGADAWELQVGDGEVAICVERSLEAVVGAYLAQAAAGGSQG